MSTEDFKGAPECGNMDCPAAVVVYRDGKRYIEHRGEYQPFDSFVRLALHEILGDLEAIKAHLRVGAEPDPYFRHKEGCNLGNAHRVPIDCKVISGLVP